MKPDYEQELRILDEVSESKSGSTPRYSNFQRIGAGGMGVVYRADDEVLLRTVAIKLILPDRESNEAYLQFQAEARATSKCDSPNLVSILDFGLTKSNRPFLIMEYVDGPALSAVIDETGPFDNDRALVLFEQILFGLEHAHKNGIVHGDLKPSNILLAKNADGGMLAKIVDFGLARFNTTGDGTGRVVEQTDELAGSPCFMSPEQVRGLKPGVRSDIYSMGCLMFTTLIGKPPFEGQSVMETMTMHLNDAPVAPGDILPECERFDNVVLKCMAKNADERYKSAQEVVNALSYFAVDEPDAPAKKSISPLLALPLIAMLIAIPLVLYVVATKHHESEEARAKSKRHKEALNKFRFWTDRDGNHCSVKEGMQVTDEELQVLQKRSFDDLSLKWCPKLTGSGLKYVQNHRLKLLDVSESPVTDAGLPYVAKIRTLETLYLGNTLVTTEGVLKLKPLKKLRTLSFRNCHADGRAVDMVVENMPEVWTLVLTDSRIKGLDLAKLKKLEKLNHLSLSGLGASPQEWEAVFDIPNLMTVALDGTNVPVSVVMRLASKPTLTSMNLQRCPHITRDIAEKIQRVKPGLIVKYGLL